MCDNDRRVRLCAISVISGRWECDNEMRVRLCAISVISGRWECDNESRVSIEHSLSLSPSRRPDMTEILLKMT